MHSPLPDSRFVRNLLSSQASNLLREGEGETLLVEAFSETKKMEQRNHNSCSCDGNRGSHTEEKSQLIYDVGFPVHSQVRKIKQESEATAVDWSTVQPEMRPVLRAREIIKRQRSRSPLGLAAGRPISVGDP